MMRTSSVPSEHNSRIEWWRRFIRRQQAASVPLTQFCRQTGVTTRKFYYWRQRLREMDAANSSRPAGLSGSSRPASTAALGTAAAFVPVSIVNPGTATQVEIELTNGCAVRLTGSIDPDLLQAAISATGELCGPGRGDR